MRKKTKKGEPDKRIKNMIRLLKKYIMCLFVPFFKPSPVGGQAIIEGVMMRSKHSVSMAVRRKNGEITCKRRAYISLSKKNRLLGFYKFKY